MKLLVSARVNLKFKRKNAHKKLFIAFFVLNLFIFDVASAQHVRKYNPIRLQQPGSHDPELKFLLKLLKGGPVHQRNRNFSTVPHDLRLFASILGRDIRIEAVKGKRSVKYIAHTDYNTIKFRLWVVNSRTSAVIGGVYHPKRLFEYKNNIFVLILSSKEVNLALKFIPEGKKYQIVAKYGQF
jgi:hypothetical protein